MHSVLEQLMELLDFAEHGSVPTLNTYHSGVERQAILDCYEAENES